MNINMVKRLTVLSLVVLLITAIGCVPVVADEDVTDVESSTVTQTSTQTDGAVVSSCEISYEVTQSSLNTYTVTIPKKVKFTSKTPSVTVSGEASLEVGKVLTVTYESGDCLLTNGSGDSITYSISPARVDGAALTEKNTVGRIIGSGSSGSFKTTLSFILGSTSGLPAGTYSDTLTFKTSIQSAS